MNVTRAIQVATGVDDQGLLTVSRMADSVLASGDHSAFGPVAQASNSYVDSVVTIRSALSMSGDDPEPQWFYTCFINTTHFTRSSASIFQAAASVPTWSQEQDQVLRQTVADMHTAAQYVHLLATGERSIDPKADILPGPNATLSPQTTCDQISLLGAKMSQRQWPG